MSEWLPLIAAIITTLLANGAGLLLTRSQRNKTNVESASILTRDALEFAKELRAEIKDLEKKVDDLTLDLEETKKQAREREDELLERIRALERENRRLNDIIENRNVEKRKLGGGLGE